MKEEQKIIEKKSEKARTPEQMAQVEERAIKLAMLPNGRQIFVDALNDLETCEEEDDHAWFLARLDRDIEEQFKK